MRAQKRGFERGLVCAQIFLRIRRIPTVAAAAIAVTRAVKPKMVAVLSGWARGAISGGLSSVSAF